MKSLWPRLIAVKNLKYFYLNKFNTLNKWRKNLKMGNRVSQTASAMSKLFLSCVIRYQHYKMSEIFLIMTLLIKIELKINSIQQNKLYICYNYSI